MKRIRNIACNVTHPSLQIRVKNASCGTILDLGLDALLVVGHELVEQEVGVDVGRRLYTETTFRTPKFFLTN